MSGYKRTVELYQKLFSLPSNIWIALLGISALVLNTILTDLLYPVDLLVAFALSGLLYFGGFLIPLLILPCRILTPRRMTALSSIESHLFVGTNIILFLVSFVFASPLSLNYIGFSYGMVLFFSSIILTSLCACKWRRVGLTLGIMMIVYEAPIFMLAWSAIDSLFLMNFIIMPFSFILSSILFFWMVDAPAKSVLGLGGVQLFQGFAEEWLEGDSKILDQLFMKIGVNEMIRIQSLEFTTEAGNCFLITPEIHPGPFKSIGSSGLSMALRNKMGKRVFITHGPSTHDLNLVSKSELKRILDILEENLAASPKNTATSSTKFLTKAENTVNVCGHIFGKFGILFASTINDNCDDIERTVGELARYTAKNVGLENLILVDSHNGVEGLSDSLKPFTQECDDMLTGVKTLASSTSSNAQFPFEAGFSHLFPTKYSVVDGFGSAGLSCLIIKVQNDLTCYLSIDCNNLVSGLRDAIVQAIKDHTKISHVEVITTDTHEVSGLDTQGMGFNPLGEKIDSNEIISLCTDLAVNAIKDLKPARVAYRETVIPDGKILGNYNMNAFTTLIGTSVKIAKGSAVSLVILLTLLNLLRLLVI